MLSRELEAALGEHRRTGLFYNPLNDLRRLSTLQVGLPTWIGQRPDGSYELVRSAGGAVALELLLNEIRVARTVKDPSLPSLLWTARTGSEELKVGYSWRAPHKLTFPLDLRWLLRSFIALAKAVAVLHRADLLHADLKPEAVSWAEDPQETLLWDLRMAQAPGLRAYEAFSARFAAPEQVAGGELSPASDVYALGVMLYSLFIRDRFPAILLPKAGGATPSAKIGPRQAALSADSVVCLFDEDEGTDFGEAYLSNNVGPPIPRQMAMPKLPKRAGGRTGPRSASDRQAILGAKILFALELERVLQRTLDIGLAKELLAVIERATAQKPAERHPDAAAFAEALAKLLVQTEG